MPIHLFQVICNIWYSMVVLSLERVNLKISGDQADKSLVFLVGNNESICLRKQVIDVKLLSVINEEGDY